MFKLCFINAVLLFCCLVLPNKAFADNARKLRDFREYYLLQNYPDLVTRNANGFTVSIKHKAKLDLVNEAYDGNNNFALYYLDKYFPEIGFMGFVVAYYESSSYQMVNLQNGETFWLDARPVVSPEHNYLIVAGFEYMNGIDPKVYKISEGDIIQVKAFNGLSLEFHSWIDSKTARMRRDPLDSESKDMLLYYDIAANDWFVTETKAKFPAVPIDNSEIELQQAYAKIDEHFTSK